VKELETSKATGMCSFLQNLCVFVFFVSLC